MRLYFKLNKLSSLASIKDNSHSVLLQHFGKFQMASLATNCERYLDFIKMAFVLIAGFPVIVVGGTVEVSILEANWLIRGVTPKLSYIILTC